MVNLVSVEVVNPRVSVGAGLLAGGELAVLGSLVVQHAPVLVAPLASARSVGEVAVEDA